MPAPLTLYLTNSADALVNTANVLTTTAPSLETTNTTLVGTSTGWGVLFANATGGGGAWPALGSEPAFGSVHGFIWDVTTLEGATIAAGTWTSTIKLSFGSTLTADLHTRVGKRSSAGVYTQIIDIVDSGITVGTTAAVYTSTGSTGSAVSFGVGDKLYIEIDLNILTNHSVKSTFSVALYENGGANNSLQTPGYTAAVNPFQVAWVRRIPLLHGGAFMAS